MIYKFFSHNGKVLPTEQAVISVNNLEYAYGFGVYETIRITKGLPYFIHEHCDRLIKSAEIIELDHPFTEEFVQKGILELIKQAEVDTANLKILLVGGRIRDDANLYILISNPLFPDRKLYKTGAKVITYEYERLLPHSKSLNMLPSYLAYRQAKQAGAYDALLINRKDYITEGTMTNFFCIKDKTIYSPPESEILLGTMRLVMIKVAKQQGYDIVEQNIPLTSLRDYDGAFLTSTSTKIMPIQSIDGYTFPPMPVSLKQLMTALNNFLETCNCKL